MDDGPTMTKEQQIALFNKMAAAGMEEQASTDRPSKPTAPSGSSTSPEKGR